MARYGRSKCNPRRTRRVPGWQQEKQPYKWKSEKGSDARRVVGQPNSTRSAVKAAWPPREAAERAGEGGWQRWLERESLQVSKDDGADKFLKWKTQNSTSEETCGLAQSGRRKEGPLINWQDLQDGELGLVNLVSLIPSLKTRPKRTFVKAQYGKTARWVWAADGG